MSGLFGSKNRRNFKSGIEKKQTANGKEDTNERYRRYNEKKRHESGLWVGLILSDFDDNFAERVKILYEGWNVSEDKVTCTIRDYAEVVQLIQRVVPDKNCVVTGLNKSQVSLTTLKGKGSESRSVKKLGEAREKALAKPEYAFQLLCSFLKQLAQFCTECGFMITLSDIKLKNLDLLSLLGKRLRKWGRWTYNYYIGSHDGYRASLKGYHLDDNLALVDGHGTKLLSLNPK